MEKVISAYRLLCLLQLGGNEFRIYFPWITVSANNLTFYQRMRIIMTHTKRLLIVLASTVFLALIVTNAEEKEKKTASPDFENPTLIRKQDEHPDGKLGSFQQGQTGDCFFLLTIIALANDPEALQCVEGVLSEKDSEDESWTVDFHNFPPIKITQKELDNYKMMHFKTHRPYPFVQHRDKDVKLIEIAADKLWKKHVRKEGLYDDIPMNAVYMFSDAKQLLFWNRAKASKLATKDIDKYKRIPEGIVSEIQTPTVDAIEKELKKTVEADKDGLCLMWIDYDAYHGYAIIDVDFKDRKVKYVNPHHSYRILTADLDKLFSRIVAGKVALNYVEIDEKPKKSTKPEDKSPSS